MVIYTVRPGDSAYSISKRYGVSAGDIISSNALDSDGSLVVGQALVIPVESVSHTVEAGESLSKIAKMYETTAEAIQMANPQIPDANFIRAGQVLTIPVTLEMLGEAEVNGYALPTIGDSTLERTLPGLTYLSVFSYEVRPDGSLTSVDDTGIVAAARRQNVAPIMSVTNIRPEGGFSGEIAHAVLSDPEVGNILLDNIAGALGGKDKYYGLNIDFEYIYPQDRENYNAFLKRAVEELHPLGYKVFTSLAPKISAEQPGLLYQAHDYKAHGSLADRVILMTYEWGYTYGPARPVAPLNLVEQVLKYAVTAIPPQKILMGIPNYGYDWTLPFVRGTAARSLSNNGAVELAKKVGARIMFDEEAQSPHFNYYSQDGKQHKVWFEDARSIRAKLELAHRYGLAGVSYWTVNTFFPQNWAVLNSTFKVKKLL
ncbi:MAG TPA: spore gernimation protein [Ruminococcaceae bacterium]|nr:spore gernimation protein [Oscillospiraceae bacterium]